MAESATRARRSVALAVLLGLAACAPQPEDHYPLDAGRTWTYALSIQPARGDAVAAESRVANLPERSVGERSTTPQEQQAFGQTRLRFVAADARSVVEIALQDAGDAQPRPKSPPNTILLAPISVGATWSTTWETNQFGRPALLPVTKTVESTDQPCVVPAGRYERCLHLRLTGSGPVDTGDGTAIVDVAGEEWFVADVGYVRGVFAETVRDRPDNDLRVEAALTAHGR